MTVSRLRAMAVAVVLLALAGCSASPVDVPSMSRTSTATTATPMPDRTRPAVGELVVGPEGITAPAGIGDLRLGSPVSSPAGDLAIVRWNAKACELNVEPEAEPAWSGLWQTTYPADPADPLQPDPFRVATRGAEERGAIVGVQVFSAQIATAKGIRIGSTSADIASAYPDATVSSTSVGGLYVVAGTAGQLLIETAAPGYLPPWDDKVVLMTVIGPSEQAHGFLGGGDVGVGCPV